MKKTALLYALGLVLLWRVVSSALLLLASLSLPAVQPVLQDANSAVMSAALQNGNFFERTMLLPWLRWDTFHYLTIALTGYTQEAQTVWPPLYPALIALFIVTGLPPLAAALIISTIAAMVVVYSLYMLAAEEKICPPGSALFFLLTFPVCFYLLAGYTESLFLALTLVSMRQARHGNLLVAGLLAALAALTRQMGVILALPLFIEGLRAAGIPGQSISIRRVLPKLACAALPLLAFAAFSLYVRFGLGFGFPWNSQNVYWRHYIVVPGWGILATLAALLKGHFPHNPLVMATDVSLAVLACVLPIQAIRQCVPMPLSFFAYFIASLLVVLMFLREDSLLMSTSRFLLGLFPLFLLQARLWTGRRTRLLWFAFSVLTQALLFEGFYAWIWIE